MPKPSDTTLLTAWLAALRSGEYKQGKNKLRTDGDFCCLGVLCDVAAKRGIGAWVPGTDRFLGPDGNVCTMFAPNEIIDALGAYLEDTKLTFMNDSENKSFAEIADYIEEQLP